MYEQRWLEEIDQSYACRSTGPTERKPDILDRALDALARVIRRIFP